MSAVGRKMKGDLSTLYTVASDFFELEGSVVMKLSPDAAIEACLVAADRGCVVARVEGGIWHDPKFEARLDCIWDGADPPITEERAKENNKLAASFIREKKEKMCGAFILTAPPLTGWPNRAKKS